jgi:hypothetical protein
LSDSSFHLVLREDSECFDNSVFETEENCEKEFTEEGCTGSVAEVSSMMLEDSEDVDDMEIGLETSLDSNILLDEISFDSQNMEFEEMELEEQVYMDNVEVGTETRLDMNNKDLDKEVTMENVEVGEHTSLDIEVDVNLSNGLEEDSAFLTDDTCPIDVLDEPRIFGGQTKEAETSYAPDMFVSIDSLTTAADKPPSIVVKLVYNSESESDEDGEDKDASREEEEIVTASALSTSERAYDEEGTENYVVSIPFEGAMEEIYCDADTSIVWSVSDCSEESDEAVSPSDESHGRHGDTIIETNVLETSQVPVARRLAYAEELGLIESSPSLAQCSTTTSGQRSPAETSRSPKRNRDLLTPPSQPSSAPSSPPSVPSSPSPGPRTPRILTTPSAGPRTPRIAIRPAGATLDASPFRIRVTSQKQNSSIIPAVPVVSEEVSMRGALTHRYVQVYILGMFINLMIILG